ncbi:MAG: alpha/beta hydrolase [Opitutales bacterium]|nr:alpha/beta hydrolase [Opitutales bacterium]
MKFILFIFFGLIICAGLYVCVLVFAFVFAERMIFPTPKSTYAYIENINMLSLKDGRKIASLFWQNKESEICVIYSHGNGEDLGKIYQLMQDYHDRLGVNVVAYDYCGYGVSDGRMSQADLSKCADTVYDYVTKTLGFKAENIFFVGYSLGSSPAAYLASKNPEARGVLIVGGVSRGVKTILPYDIIPWKILHNVEYYPNIKIPVLFFHGTRDKIVHIRNAYENLEAAKNTVARLVKFYDYGHFPLFESELYWRELSNFIKNTK